MDRKNIVLLRNKSTPYAKRLKALFGSSLIAYYPLDETIGTTAYDKSGNGRNGTYANATLGYYTNTFGRPSPKFSGTNSTVNFYSTSFASAFNGSEGSMFGRFYPTDTVWTDAANRRLFNITGDANNYIDIRKFSTVNVLVFEYDSGSSLKQVQKPFAKQAWFDVGITWSASNNRVRFYVNGIKTDELTGLGVWSGAMNTDQVRIASNTGTAACWDGGASDFVVLNREATEAEMYKASGRNYRLTVIGESISQAGFGYINTIESSIRKGAALNHAIAGMGVVSGISNLPAQVITSSNDNADVIIIALGTVDNNAGDMLVLKNTVVSGIDSLRISNPRAQIYYMNVLPRWTTASGTTPVDKANIRAAIQSGCLLRGVDCWDTFTNPWITAAQTSDGLHPTASGHLLIANQILTKLPK